MVMPPLAGIRAAFAQRTYQMTRHGIEQCLDRDIPIGALRQALAEDRPEIIEDYPNDPRGPSCLILCYDRNGVAYHVQCTYPPIVYLVTAYKPDPGRWPRDL